MVLNLPEMEICKAFSFARLCKFGVVLTSVSYFSTEPTMHLSLLFECNVMWIIISLSVTISSNDVLLYKYGIKTNFTITELPNHTLTRFVLWGCLFLYIPRKSKSKLLNFGISCLRGRERFVNVSVHLMQICK